MLHLLRLYFYDYCISPLRSSGIRFWDEDSWSKGCIRECTARVPPLSDASQSEVLHQPASRSLAVLAENAGSPVLSLLILDAKGTDPGTLHLLMFPGESHAP